MWHFELVERKKSGGEFDIGHRCQGSETVIDTIIRKKKRRMNKATRRNTEKSLDFVVILVNGINS